MKKKIPFIMGILCLLILLAGCTTTVTLSYMKPSRVNMGPYRNIAVASTRDESGFQEPPFFIKTADPQSADKFGRVFSSFSKQLSRAVAEDATSRLMSTLTDTNFFSILGPKQTDEILDNEWWGTSRRELFRKKGVDAVVIPKIENMSASEWIRSTQKEVMKKNEDGTSVKVMEPVYWYEYEIFIRWSYTVVDADTEKLVARESYQRRYSDSVAIDSRNFTPAGLREKFDRILDSFMETLRQDLVPVKETVSISLMKDESGIRKADMAYELLEDGQYLTALEMLSNVWIDEKSIPAGYNTALLLAGTGNWEDAVTLLDEVIRYGGGKDALWLKGEIMDAWKSDLATEEMLRGGKPEGIRGQDIYDTLGV